MTTLTTQEKIDRLIPYIWDNFMELQHEYDFHIIINFHYFLKPWFEMPEQFKDWIGINNCEHTSRLDIEKISKDFWDGWLNKIEEIDTDKYEIRWKEDYYEFICESRFEETEQYQNIDDVDFLLDKVNEFLIYLKEYRWK